MLKIGRQNNVVQWKEDMQNEACGLYGMTGMFFSTNRHYVQPYPREEDYNPTFQTVDIDDPTAGIENEEDEDGSVDPDDVMIGPQLPPLVPIVYSEALIDKLRAGAFEGRRKAVEAQRTDEQKLWSLMWSRMSPGSKSKVREEPEFESCRLRLDSVQLWEFIRRSHLTHIYGDSMRAVNIHEQTLRYNYLRQGEREYIGDFKTRFDNQVLANKGVGMTEVEGPIRAIDFLSKLDPKRYTGMLTFMRNNAVQNIPNSYPSTLAGAYRVASSWTNAGGMVPLGAEQHSAFLTDNLPATKEKVPGKGSKDKTGSTKKKSSSVICFVCGKTGHFAKDCEKRKLGEHALLTAADEPTEDDDDESIEAAFVTTDEIALFTRSHVLLDNQASVNIFCNPGLLSDIRKSRHAILLNGVQLGAAGVRVDQEGDFGDIGPVYYSSGATANILSFAAMADSGAEIRYDHEEGCFILRPAGSTATYRFSRQDLSGSTGRFYVCDASGMATHDQPRTVIERALVTTVEDNMRRFTKREIASAAAARELLARMGYPPVEMAIAMIRGGNNFSVSEADFRNAHTIWGKCLASMRGKTHKKSSPKADISLTPAQAQQQQVLSVDIMYLEATAILIAVSTPLDMTLAVSLIRFDSGKTSRQAAVVKPALCEMISILKSRNFLVHVIMSDGEGAIGKMRLDLMALGIEVDVSAAGGHVARIERRIQMVKERTRAHICGRLPFTLTELGNTYLTLYCVSRINCQQSGTRPGGLSPRELFSGRRVDGTLDFRAAFGDYAVCTAPNTDNTMTSRTEDCIVMLPTHSRTGSFKMLSLATGKIVTRDQFKILPMPQSVIATLNAMAVREGKKITQTKLHVFDETLFANSLDKSNLPTFITNPPTQDAPVVESAVQQQPTLTDLPSADIFEIPPSDVGGRVAQSVETAVVPDEIRILELEPIGVHGQDVLTPPPSPTPLHIQTLPDDIPDDAPVPDSDSIAQPVQQTVREQRRVPAPTERMVTRSSRTSEDAFVVVDGITTAATVGKTVSCHSVEEVLQRHRDEMTKSNTANISVKEAFRTRGEDAKRVVVSELKQMLDKRVWVPVMGGKLSAMQRATTIRSSMFLKQKNNPNGSFLKLKARLVAGGDQQDKSLYEDLSSPTVSTSAVFSLLAIAAHEERRVAVVDISGAYLNADMALETPVHMRLDRTMADLIIDIDPTYSKYTDARGGVTVHLKKALYGCVESSGLWYENLHATMVGLGYVRNICDKCVFNRTGADGHQCTAAVHVDDLLITSKSKDSISHLVDGLRTRYGAITLSHGPVINYLGMAIDMHIPGQAMITTTGYCDEIAKISGVKGTARSPATEGLFDTREGAAPVSEPVRVWFHKVVAMVLYLAKRTKPECLVAVAYLATRVHKCTLDDVEKLQRLVRYIHATRDSGVVLRPGAGGISVRLFVDASYGVHSDGRSHTGSCVVIGDVGAVHCRSSKQLIVTKSSTEAELVGLSDSANQSIFIRTFLIAQGYKMKPVIIYQDNQSCMALVERGRSGAERTRHIQIRYFWVKERVDTGEVRVEYLRSEDMYANVLTKPLQGSQFMRERDGLTGWASESEKK